MTEIDYFLDAHALVWFLESNPRLGNGAKQVLTDTTSRLFLPVTALAEVCWIVEGGKSSIPSIQELMQAIDADNRVTIVPLDREILDISHTLKAVGEMHDRQIVATAIRAAQQGRTVALLTRDQNITASGLVPIVW